MTDRPGTTASTVDRVMALPARVGGAALATAVRGLKLARPAEKPLHPRGEYFRATVTRFGGGVTGVAWLDDAGADEVVARRSRAIGLPPRGPTSAGSRSGCSWAALTPTCSSRRPGWGVSPGSS